MRINVEFRAREVQGDATAAVIAVVASAEVAEAAKTAEALHSSRVL